VSAIGIGGRSIKNLLKLTTTLIGRQTVKKVTELFVHHHLVLRLKKIAFESRDRWLIAELRLLLSNCCRFVMFSMAKQPKICRGVLFWVVVLRPTPAFLLRSNFD
jgi:hypothetical protein